MYIISKTKVLHAIILNTLGFRYHFHPRATAPKKKGEKNKKVRYKNTASTGAHKINPG